MRILLFFEFEPCLETRKYSAVGGKIKTANSLEICISGIPHLALLFVNTNMA